jgi:DNA polymerase III delta subunit
MVIVLTGKNSFALQKELQKVTAEFIATHGDSIERFDASEMAGVDPVLDAVRSISFLEPRKLVIVKDFGQSKELMDRIEDILSQVAESTDLLLVDPKLDKRTAGYKYLQKNVELKEYKPLQEYDVEKWLVNEATLLGVKLSPSNAKHLVHRVGNDQLRVEQELKKLASSGKDVTKDHIDSLTEPQPTSKVFDMLDALFQGNLNRAWELYKDQRAQGEDPHKIIAMITWQLSQLTLAVHAPIKTVDTLKSAGVSPYGAQKLLKMAQSISKEQLADYINELADIDEQIKTSADVESALETYFVYVCRKV